MPIPFLLAGLGVAAAALGAAGHMDAKETNEKAQRISEEAKELYDDAKCSLEQAKNNAEEKLLKLGYEKKNILDTSMNQFVNAYDKIMHLQFEESIGISEVSNLTIDRQGVLEIKRMTDIYSSSIQSGATGAATGAIVALAANGSLTVVTGGLATAGSALLAGEVGVAAGIAGSALSFGAAMTPLAAVAAPVVLFTGISASMKADENLEKANTMYAKAEAAAEKMKVSEVMCDAISEKSEMFNKLLLDLNSMFTPCVVLLEREIKKKEGRIVKKKLTESGFTKEHKKLISVTRALAGAIKAVIDTPILGKDGNLSLEAEEKYNAIVEILPEYEKQVQEVKSYTFNTNTNVNANINTVHTNLTDTPKKGETVIGCGCLLGVILVLGALIIGLGSCTVSYIKAVFSEESKIESIDDVIIEPEITDKKTSLSMVESEEVTEGITEEIVDASNSSIVENLDDNEELELIVNETPEKVTEKDFIISGIVCDKNYDGKIYVYVNETLPHGYLIYCEGENQTWTDTLTLEVGENVLKIVAESTGGKKAIITKTIVLELEGPELIIGETPEKTKEKDIIIKGTLYDANHEVKQYVFLNDVLLHSYRTYPSGTKWEWLESIKLLEGENVLKVEAESNSGKITTVTRNIVLDSEGPELIIGETPEKTKEKDIIIRGTLYDKNYEVKQYVYLNDVLQHSYSTYPSGTKWEWSESIKLLEGENVLKVVVKSDSGKTTTITRTIVLDSEGPELIINETPEKTKEKDIIIRGTLYDKNYEVKQYVYLNDVLQYSYSIYPSGTKWEWLKSIKLLEGENVLKVVAKSDSGKTTTITRTIVLESEGPEVIIGEIPEKVTDKDLIISASIYEEYYEVKRYVYLNDVLLYSYSILPPGTVWEWRDYVTLQEGENVYKIVAKSDSGKTTTVTKIIYYEK